MLNITRFRNRRIALIQGERIIAVIQNRTYHIDHVQIGVEARRDLRIVRAELLPAGTPCEVGQLVPEDKVITHTPARAGGDPHGKAR